MVSAIEHPAVLDPARALEKAGAALTLVPVDGLGRVDAKDVDRAIDERTALVSVMTANSEVGTVQPVAEIAAICRERGVAFHTDAGVKRDTTIGTLMIYSTTDYDSLEVFPDGSFQYDPTGSETIQEFAANGERLAAR